MNRLITIFTLLCISSMILASNLFATEVFVEHGHGNYIPHTHKIDNQADDCKLKKTFLVVSYNAKGSTFTEDERTVGYLSDGECLDKFHDGKSHEDVPTMRTTQGAEYLRKRWIEKGKSVRDSDWTPNPHIFPDEESPDFDEPNPDEDPQVTWIKGCKASWKAVGEEVCEMFYNNDHYSPVCCQYMKDLEAKAASAPKVVRRGKLTLTWGALKKGR